MDVLNVLYIKTVCSVYSTHCFHRYVCGSFFLCLRGWRSWWHTTMHFQSQWFHETWQNKNQPWHYSTHSIQYVFTVHIYKKNTEWTLYRVLLLVPFGYTQFYINAIQFFLSLCSCVYTVGNECKHDRNRKIVIDISQWRSIGSTNSANEKKTSKNTLIHSL